ncbi:MAG: trehalase family glycosidase [Gemmataceae bacterium]
MTPAILSPREVAPVLDHIDQLWPSLIHHQPRDKGKLLKVPHPYVTPANGRMFRKELYYWDTFFTSLGFEGTPRERMIPGFAHNLAHLYRRFGIIPNANCYYFLSRSQPPFLTQLIWLGYRVLQKITPCGPEQALLVERKADDAHNFLRETMEVARREHNRVWMGKDRLTYAGLSRYFDINQVDWAVACESGWDHTTRCDDRWLSHLPVDLNSILYVRERDIAKAAEVLGESRRAERWHEMADRRRETIRELMFDDNAGFFFDYDVDRKQVNPHPSLAGFYPLWAGLATEDQAKLVVHKWLPEFERAGGLLTTLEESHEKQWAAPNGWAPLMYLVTEGLDRYGYHQDADRLRAKWVKTCLTRFQQTGHMFEKYNVRDVDQPVEGGVYGQLTGFGWTNSIFVVFARKLGLCQDTEPNTTETYAPLLVEEIAV